MSLTELLQSYKPIGEIKGQGTLELYGTLLPRDRLRLNTGSTLPTIGTYSDFRPGRNIGLGVGITRGLPEFDITERFRPPDLVPSKHINYEILLNEVRKNKRINPLLSNTHIYGDY